MKRYIDPEALQLQQMSAWLRGTLWRHECPPPERLALYQMRLLSAAEQLTLAAHVRQCAACQEELAQFADVPKAPSLAALLQQAHKIFEAVLLPQPAGGALRGPTGTSLQRFETPELEIHLSVQPGLEAGQRTLLGRLIPKPDANVTLLGVEVALFRGQPAWAARDAAPATAVVETGGLFTFEGLEPGTYQLAVPVLDKIIKISDVGVT